MKLDFSYICPHLKLEAARGPNELLIVKQADVIFTIAIPSAPLKPRQPFWPNTISDLVLLKNHLQAHVGIFLFKPAKRQQLINTAMRRLATRVRQESN